MIVVLRVVGCGGGAYAYTRQLLALDCKLLALDCKWPGRAERMFLAVPGWSDIASPRVWEAALASHPDIKYCSYLVQGLRDGFRIGFGYGLFKCTSAGSNMQSAKVRPSVITDFLSAELRAG